METDLSMTSNMNIPEPLPKLGGLHSITTTWRFKPEFYRLVGSICRNCGVKHFPRRQVCSACGSRELPDVELSHTGKIRHIAWGHLRGMVKGYEDMAPQIFCSIELDDGPVLEAEVINIPHQLRRKEFINPNGWKFVDSLAGKKVRMVFRRLRKLDNGIITYGYKFVMENPTQDEARS